MGKICIVCGTFCDRIIKEIKNYCCWHVPTESIKKPRSKWICLPCKYMERQWRKSTRYNDPHLWDSYPPTKEP